MMKKFIAVAVAAAAACSASALTTCADGVFHAPEAATPPAIDGDLADWPNKAGGESCWIADEMRDVQRCTVWMMHDASNLYFAADMLLGDHDATNVNRPMDRYWRGDLLQLRLSTDKSLGHPLPQANRKNPNPAYVKNPKVTCVNMWRNTAAGEDCLYVSPGAFFDCGNTLNPEGSAFAVRTRPNAMTFEARIPWTALGVADGVRPYSVGETMPAVLDVKWHPGLDGHYTAMIYRKDPGAFAFLNLDTWGLVKFEEAGWTPPPSAAAARGAPAASAAANAAPPPNIRFDLPRAGYVSVNVFDERGGVVRELIGGERREAGEVALHWDGRDAFGFPCAAGEYRWGAYANDGVDVEYFGTVGTSGTPPYETPDGKGGWGADHGDCMAAAADATGRYFVWYKYEQGRGFVKTDFDGNVVWRTAPFVLGGFGAFTCAASDGSRLFAVFDDGRTRALVQLDAATGLCEPFPDGAASVALDCGGAVSDGAAKPNVYTAGVRLNCTGVAVGGGEVFVSDFGGGKILVHDAATGRKKGEIPCAAPRGLAFANGALLAVSGSRVVRVRRDSAASGAAHGTVVDSLDEPYGLAVGADGSIYVSEWGASQRVKRFSPDGRPVRAYGKAGGRTALGAYDRDAFRRPGAIAVDPRGALIVPEISLPKVFTVVDAADGRTLRRYFGHTSYSTTNVPDCDDPLLQYYSLEFGAARARLPAAGGTGEPDACWNFYDAGLPEFGNPVSTMDVPEVVRAENGAKYLVTETQGAIFRINGDALAPVARIMSASPKAPLEVWTDLDGDGRIGDGETRAIETVGGERMEWSLKNGAKTMDAHGNVLVTTLNNKVLEIPSDGFDERGAPRLDVGRVRVAIPEIVPGLKRLHCTWRDGLTGLRRDSAGNFYGTVAWSPDYATPALTAKMHVGMGHSSHFTAVKIMKWAPDGRPVWSVGRKATGSPKPGEIMHHWTIAGLVGDGYAASASENGPFFIYTADGFYAGRLFDAPGRPGRGVPYVFGGEDFSGQIRFFPERGEVWAYNAGHTFRVLGFEGGRIKGEWRTSGVVSISEASEAEADAGAAKAAALGETPAAFPDGAGTVALRRTEETIVCDFAVADDTPLVNSAKTPDAVFKGGDAVGVSFGPVRSKPPAEIPSRNGGDPATDAGYCRILAAVVDGRPVVAGMKPLTDGAKRPQDYWTPAGGAAHFDWIGEVPGASAEFTRTADGYAVRVVIPRTFLECDSSGELAAEAEILFSGEGPRGVGTVRRAYLFSPPSPATSMTDDTPTESRLRPVGWGRW